MTAGGVADRNGEMLAVGDVVEWCLIDMEGKPKRPRAKITGLGRKVETRWGPAFSVRLESGSAMTWALEKVSP